MPTINIKGRQYEGRDIGELIAPVPTEEAEQSLFIDGSGGVRQATKMQWYEIKNWLELVTGLDRDSLHIYAAVGIQLIMALFVRRSLASMFPWLAVLFVALGNEYLDYQRAGNDPDVLRLASEEAWRDIWNTMLLPTIFLLIARVSPQWLVGKSESKPSTTPVAEPDT